MGMEDYSASTAGTAASTGPTATEQPHRAPAGRLKPLEGGDASRKMHEYLINQQRRKEEYWLRKYGKVLASPHSSPQKSLKAERSLPPILHSGRNRQRPGLAPRGQLFEASGPISSFPGNARPAPLPDNRHNANIPYHPAVVFTPPPDPSAPAAATAGLLQPLTSAARTAVQPPQPPADAAGAGLPGGSSGQPQLLTSLLSPAETQLRNQGEQFLPAPLRDRVSYGGASAPGAAKAAALRQEASAPALGATMQQQGRSMPGRLPPLHAEASGQSVGSGTGFKGGQVMHKPPQSNMVLVLHKQHKYEHVGPRVLAHNKGLRDLEMELAVLKSIKAREDVLDRLRVASDKLGARVEGTTHLVLPPADPLVRLFYRLIGQLRSRTLDCVETLAAWHRRNLSGEPFLYYGSPYMRNIGPDLAFLDQQHFVRVLSNGMTAVQDPFLLHITPDSIPLEEVTTADMRRGTTRYSPEALRIRIARKVLATYCGRRSPQAGAAPNGLSSPELHPPPADALVPQQDGIGYGLGGPGCLDRSSSSLSSLREEEEEEYQAAVKAGNEGLAPFLEDPEPSVSDAAVSGAHDAADQPAAGQSSTADEPAASAQRFPGAGSGSSRNLAAVVSGRSAGRTSSRYYSSEGTPRGEDLASGDPDAEGGPPGVEAQTAVVDQAVGLQQLQQQQQQQQQEQLDEASGVEDESPHVHGSALAAWEQSMELDALGEGATAASAAAGLLLPPPPAVLSGSSSRGARRMREAAGDAAAAPTSGAVSLALSGALDYDLDDGAFIDFAVDAMVTSLEEPYSSQLGGQPFTISGWEIDNQLDNLVTGLGRGTPAPGSAAGPRTASRPGLSSAAGLPGSAAGAAARGQREGRRRSTHVQLQLHTSGEEHLRASIMVQPRGAASSASTASATAAAAAAALATSEDLQPMQPAECEAPADAELEHMVGETGQNQQPEEELGQGPTISRTPSQMRHQPSQQQQHQHQQLQQLLQGPADDCQPCAPGGDSSCEPASPVKLQLSVLASRHVHAGLTVVDDLVPEERAAAGSTTVVGEDEASEAAAASQPAGTTSEQPELLDTAGYSAQAGIQSGAAEPGAASTDAAWEAKQGQSGPEADGADGGATSPLSSPVKLQLSVLGSRHVHAGLTVAADCEEESETATGLQLPCDVQWEADMVTSHTAMASGSSPDANAAVDDVCASSAGLPPALMSALQPAGLADASGQQGEELQLQAADIYSQEDLEQQRMGAAQEMCEGHSGDAGDATSCLSASQEIDGMLYNLVSELMPPGE